MFYLFSKKTLSDLQLAFSTATVINEGVNHNFEHSWYQFFIKFSQPVELNDEQNNHDLISCIFKGDKAFSSLIKQQHIHLADAEVAFRWHGNNSCDKKILACGFSFEFKIKKDKTSLAQAKKFQLKILVDAGIISVDSFCLNGLVTNHLIAQESRHHLEVQCLQTLYSDEPVREPSVFFSPAVTTLNPTHAVNDLLSAAENYIKKHLTAIPPKYRRPNELSINPAYHDLDSFDVPVLAENQPYIWLLCSNLTLPLGIKNAYHPQFGCGHFRKAFSPQNLFHIGLSDRFGHPSLAIPYSGTEAIPGYDGKAYYGGYITRRQGVLDIFLSSGRFAREGEAEFDETQLAIIEAYLTLRFQKNLGIYDVVFTTPPDHSRDFYELSIYNFEPLSEEAYEKRRYTTESAQAIIQTHCLPVGCVKSLQ